MSLANRTSRLRLIVLQALVVSLFATLGVRLWYLQVAHGSSYRAQAASQSVRDVVEQPTRGLIVDDMGRPLVNNRTAWVVSIDKTTLGNLSEDDQATLLARVAKVTGVKVGAIKKTLATWNGSAYQPVPIAEDVEQQVALQILEQPEDYPGVVADQETVRNYPQPYGVNAADVLGYLSPITASEYTQAKKDKDTSLNATSEVGRAGVEKEYDKWLRGMPGYTSVAVDSLGRELGDSSEVAAQPGDTLVTSIDAKVQATAEQALHDAITTARATYDPVTHKNYVADSGAMVVMEAKTGRVVRVHGGATLPDDIGWQPTEHPGRTLGMVVPSLEYYWPDVVKGARAAAKHASASILLRGSSYDEDEDRRQISALLRSGADALLLAPAAGTRTGRRLISWVASLPVPVVLMERQAPLVSGSHRLGWVATDHPLGAEIAVRHLAAQGHRRIAAIVGRLSPTSTWVVRGWRRACTLLGLDVDPQADLITVDPPSADGRRDAHAALDAVLARGATAVLVHSDLDALALLDACADRGVRVPADLAVVAYDDELAATGTPALTAVRPPREEVGRRAVEILVDRLTYGADLPAQRVQIVPSLVVRDSSHRVPVEARH